METDFAAIGCAVPRRHRRQVTASSPSGNAPTEALYRFQFLRIGLLGKGEVDRLIAKGAFDLDQIGAQETVVLITGDYADEFANIRDRQEWGDTVHLHHKIARMLFKKFGDVLLTGSLIVSEGFRALMEADSFILGDPAEGRVLGIHPDLIEHPGLFAVANRSGNQGDAGQFPEIFLFQSLTAHPGGDHGDYHRTPRL